MATNSRKIDEAGRMNSLGLTPSKLDTFLDRIDKDGAQKPVKRYDARWPFRQSSITVIVSHPGGSQVEVQMACRNLSKGGAGFLHSTFVYNGTRCIVALPHPEHGLVPVEGEVVRCEHREGVIHEIGVKFDEEIDVRGFANPNPLSQLFSAERVDAAKLNGTLLHVEPNEHDANTLKHLLKDTMVRVVSASNAKEGLAAAQKGVDMIVSEFALDDMSGSEFVVQLRSENFSKPLVFLTHDVGERVTNAVKRRMAQAMIRKPLTEETLLPALAEFLKPGDDSGAAPEPAVNTELAESLKPELTRCARQIESAMKNSKAIEIVGACHVLQQVAGVIGLTRLSEDVSMTIAKLSKDMDVEGSTDVLNLIIEQCRRAA